MTTTEQPAIGTCPQCGGKTIEQPYSRFSKCQTCGTKTPTKDAVKTRG